MTGRAAPCGAPACMILILNDEEEAAVLPHDPMILLSYVNTKLRDEYPSLEALCEGLDADQSALETALAAVGFHYDAERNTFV